MSTKKPRVKKTSMKKKAIEVAADIPEDVAVVDVPNPKIKEVKPKRNFVENGEIIMFVGKKMADRDGLAIVNMIKRWLKEGTKEGDSVTKVTLSATPRYFQTLESVFGIVQYRNDMSHKLVLNNNEYGRLLGAIELWI